MNSETDFAASRETDTMVCRACGNEERASEGFECRLCDRFICIGCTVRGVTLCKNCDAEIVT